MESTEREPQTLWNRSYIFVLFVSLLSSFSFYMVATIMSKYLVGIGIAVSMAGVVVGLFSVTSLVCRPACGIMADRLNNVNLLRYSNILMCLGLVGFAFAHSLPLIVLFRILNGVGFAIGGTAQITLATRYIPKHKTGEGIGYMGLGMVVSSAAAPGIGLAIAEATSMQITFLASAAMTLLAFLLLLTMKDQHHQKSEKNAEKKRISPRDILEPKALPFTLTSATFSFANGMIASYLVLFADERSIVGISIYFTVYAVCLFVIRPLSGKLMDAKGLRVTVFPGLILTAASMFILGRSATLPLILVTGVMRAFGQGAAQPSLQAGCINYLGRERSGVATSTYYLGGDIGQGFAPMLGGVILTAITGIAGYRLIFDLCGVLMVTALVYFFIVCQKKEIR